MKWWQRLGLVKVLLGIGGAIINNMDHYLTGEPLDALAVILTLYLLTSGTFLFVIGKDSE